MKLIYIVLILVIILALVAGAVLAMGHKGAFGGGEFRLRVSDPEYTALLNGTKTVEARLDRAPFNTLTVGSSIVVIRSRPAGDTSEYPGGQYKYNAEIKRITKYTSLKALISAETLQKVYPGRSEADATARFNEYVPPGASASDAVIAIELRAQKSDKKTAKRSHSQRRGGDDESYSDSYGESAGVEYLDD